MRRTHLAEAKRFHFHVFVPRTLFWTPRAVAILFAVFLALFALDVFEEGGRPEKMVVAFLVHLMPALLVGLVVVLSWRHELFGAITFFALGVLYTAGAWARFPWSVYAVIAGPLFLVSALLLVNWVSKRKAVPTALRP
jgi:hypothetical protein